MSQITDEQVEAATQAWYASGSDMHEAMRAALEAALSTPPVGAETGEPVADEAWERTLRRILVKNLPPLSSDEEWDRAFNGLLAALLAAPPRSDKANGDLVTEVEGLIDAYWSIAYDEGYFRRETDTSDGRAQTTRSAISRHLRAISTSPAIPNTVGEDKL